MTNETFDERIRSAIATVARSAHAPIPFEQVAHQRTTMPPGPRRHRIIWALTAAAVVAAIAVVVAVVVGTTSDADRRHATRGKVHSERPVSSASRGPIVIRLTLPGSVLRAGQTMTGTVDVKNNTGQPIPYTYCGALFQVTLENRAYQPQPFWTACAMPGTLPAGNSAFAVTFSARPTICTTTPQPSISPCQPDGSAPPLSPGAYRAQLRYTPGNELGPLPPPITVRVTRDGPPPHTARRKITGYDVGGLPAGLAETRRYEQTTPTGGTAQIRWYSVSDSGPTLTTNLTTGKDIGASALADTRARAADLITQSERDGISLPAPTEFAVHGQPAVAYSDLLGWRSLSWVVNRDTVMAITGLRFSDAQLQQIAEGVRFR